MPKQTAIKDHPYTVHYVLPNHTSGARCRPAVVVLDWSPDVYPPDGACNLVVFVDGTNDGYSGTTPVVWATSVRHTQDGNDHTYHHQGECASATAARAEVDAAAAAAAEARAPEPEPAFPARQPGESSTDYVERALRDVPPGTPTTMTEAAYGTPAPADPGPEGGDGR